jgi:hypothetical protein
MTRFLLWCLLAALLVPPAAGAAEDQTDLLITYGTGTATVELKAYTGSVSRRYFDYEGEVFLELFQVEGEALHLGPGIWDYGVNYKFKILPTDVVDVSDWIMGEWFYETDTMWLQTGLSNDASPVWTTNYPEYPSAAKAYMTLFFDSSADRMTTFTVLEYSNDGAFFNLVLSLFNGFTPEGSSTLLEGTITISGQFAEPVAVERTHWGAIKNLYR